MKIEATVLSVSDEGNRLRVTAQGETLKSAEWHPMCRVEFSIPMTEPARKAYHVGRRFDVILKPQ